MAYIFPNDVTFSISLEEYLEVISKAVDSNSLDSIVRSATYLQALANNRSFLSNYLNEQLASFESFQKGNSHGPQSLILGKVGNLGVRVNVWLPASEDRTLQAMEDKVFSYQIPHDHNFHFLTVGYSGPGYETAIYEYDNGRVEGYVGERVDVRFLQKTFLTKGKVIGFRASKDIHTQLYPSALSVSINLLSSSQDALLKDQFYFDINKSCITGFVNTLVSARSTVLSLAEHLGNDDTCDVLDTISKRHPTPRTRADAYRAFARLRPQEAERVFRRASRDASAFVRRRAAEVLGSEAPRTGRHA